MFLSKSFLTFIGRLLAAGVIVLGSFHFGSAFFIADVFRETERADVRNFAEEISRSPVGNLTIYIHPVRGKTTFEEGSSADHAFQAGRTSNGIQNDKKVIPSETIKKWFEPYVRNYTGKEDVRILPEKIEGYLVSIAPSVNIQPINAKFVLVDGKAEEFSPSEYGRNLDIDASKRLIMNALISGKKEVGLPIELIEPAITLARVNELGITTLIGRGESDFKGSPPSRIHNIRIGSAKFNGTILKPGEKFSFNSILGGIDEENGYQPELVIKEGKLVYEYGGGLCQVSTTLFRAAIMAGLPILERKPHSFPVRYYDPQGFDATIYPGGVDLKFKNDTSAYVLIQSRVEGTKLIFDIYGPDDNRKVALDGPYQHDQKSNGSMKAHFVRKIVYADGSVKEERFDSAYGAPAPLERNPLE